MAKKEEKQETGTTTASSAVQQAKQKRTSIEVRIIPFHPEKMKVNFYLNSAEDSENPGKLIIESNPIWKEKFANKYKLTENEENTILADKENLFKGNSKIQNLSYTISPGGAVFNLEKEYDLLNFLICLSSQYVCLGKENKNYRVHPIFYVEYVAEASSNSIDEAKMLRDALSEVGKMSKNEIARTARVFGIQANNSSEEVLEGSIYNEARRNPRSFLARLSSETFEFEKDFYEFLEAGILEIDGRRFKYEGEDIAFTIEGAIQYLIANSQKRMRMKARLIEIRDLITTAIDKDIPSTEENLSSLELLQFLKENE